MDRPSNAPRILVVEDESSIREPLAAALADEGYRARALADGGELLAELEAFRPDLAVLDVMLPGSDGFALARQVRARGEVPIVFLTGRDAPEDRLRGFAAGGDDYVVKPFLLAELLARVRAVLRRSGRLRSEVIEIDDLLVDEAATTVHRAGRAIDLTATEYRLLVHLARHRGRTLSKLQILTQVWGYDEFDPNLVEVHVSALRRKLEAGAAGRPLIRTIRGRGYALRAPSEP